MRPIDREKLGLKSVHALLSCFWNGHHNHPPSGALAIPQARRIPAAIAAQIQGLAQVGLTARQIQLAVWYTQPDLPLLRADISNHIYRTRRAGRIGHEAQRAIKTKLSEDVKLCRPRLTHVDPLNDEGTRAPRTSTSQASTDRDLSATARDSFQALDCILGEPTSSTDAENVSATMQHAMVQRDRKTRLEKANRARQDRLAEEDRAWKDRQDERDQTYRARQNQQDEWDRARQSRLDEWDRARKQRLDKEDQERRDRHEARKNRLDEEERLRKGRYDRMLEEYRVQMSALRRAPEVQVEEAEQELG
ncbi:MAG: hypothetical protein TREMPRED_005913 [Tremellales sp. Tagirdzhanova-0007]|nr:MAG: hypothetical protein TREMPRED_005913 [Tremellales sp. Tagirdzhanova-0007]